MFSMFFSQCGCMSLENHCNHTILSGNSADIHIGCFIHVMIYLISLFMLKVPYTKFPTSIKNKTFFVISDWFFNVSVEFYLKINKKNTITCRKKGEAYCRTVALRRFRIERLYSDMHIHTKMHAYTQAKIEVV